MSTYTPEWARANNPTVGMSEKEMTAYYKGHSLEGDALFALRAGTDTPAVILAGWRAVRLALAARKGKASPALKAEGARLRTLTREWLQAQPTDARFALRATDRSEAA